MSGVYVRTEAASNMAATAMSRYRVLILSRDGSWRDLRQLPPLKAKGALYLMVGRPRIIRSYRYCPVFFGGTCVDRN